jgi:hypothetical protein
VETHPYIGEPGAHQFNIVDNEPPVILSPDSIDCPLSEEFAYYPFIDDVDNFNHDIEYEYHPVWLTVQNDSLLGTAPDYETIDSFEVCVSDPYTEVCQVVHIYVYDSYLCGDPDNSGAINILDVTFLISYLYKDGPAPEFPNSADVNNSGDVNLLDITYIIAFLYQGGPEPDCP